MAADGASKDDAIAMVKKAVAFIKEQGADKAYPEFTGKDANSSIATCTSSSISSTARCWPTARTPKFVGKDLSDAQDVDGKLYVKERVELAAKQPSFWQDYKFVNPVSKKVEPKQMYCEKRRQHRGVRRHLQALTRTTTVAADRRIEGLICSAGSRISGCPGKFSSRRRS